MHSIGCLLYHELSIPIRSLSLKIQIQCKYDVDTYFVLYNEKRKTWIMDDELLTIQNTLISLPSANFILSLPIPSDKYLYEIEDIAVLILNEKDQPVYFKTLYKKIKTKYGEKTKPKKYYAALLADSICFIQIRMFDAIGNSLKIWKVDKTNLGNFQKMKNMQQSISINTTDLMEKVNVSYDQKKAESTTSPYISQELPQTFILPNGPVPSEDAKKSLPHNTPTPRYSFP
ncbi:hypothetical protein NERG_02504 [Nematocida ausubeli]|uniref:Uncharacterized protein n=1 Tax=Nematocida ausubeli (strain ATCC PRA-371 / ERTm2) TaxID=1913371 RepID=H8ZFY3_NEMA1|nr:hypothetical protein NERG_02504 [Nematocida ausubeli]